ncbi:MAG TPA: alpha/beta fold hydrolase [Dehalococcoidia bacterium]|nr:alpha/beta fold hydrolase [Dehalococcoidia bacterium]
MASFLKTPVMKKWLKYGLILLGIIIVAFVGVSGYMGYSMTRQERKPLDKDPGDIGLAYEEVDFPDIDEELILRGWFLTNDGSDRVIVMVHGNEANRDDPSIGTLDIAGALVDHGYNVLMFDLRGCGESEGDMVSGGYHEKKDILGAVEHVRKRGFNNIGVIGFSLGAVSSLLAAAETKDIDAVVADSSYADLNDIMGPEFSKRTKAPQIMLKPMLFMIRLMFGVDFSAIRPIDCVPEITPRPIFFIHGQEDDTIPVEHADRLYQAAENPLNRIWVVPETNHVRSYITHPEEYIRRITDFFDTALR